jgi:tight adherence protein B
MFLFFGVVVLIWVSAMAVWWILSGMLRSSDFTKVKDRLAGKEKKGSGAKAKLSAKPKHLLQRDLAGGRLVDFLKKWELLPKLQTLIDQAGFKWNPLKTIQACCALFLAGYAFCWVLLPSQFKNFAYLVGLVCSGIPILYIMRARTKRLMRFEELFPESLEFVARSMRAGHAFSVSLEMIHREFQEPISGEFRRSFEEHNLGLPLDVALQKMAKRVPSLDVHFFVSAVLLQKRTGGNLAEILDKLAYVIRERFKLRGRIRAISAHGKMTGMALTCIPIGVALLMFWVNPDYVRFFFLDEVGNYMMGAAVLLQIIGYLIMRKIVQIDVN